MFAILRNIIQRMFMKIYLFQALLLIPEYPLSNMNLRLCLILWEMKNKGVPLRDAGAKGGE
jgi:hypothetical protein